MGVFDKYQSDVYPFTFEVDLLVSNLHGGVPTDPKVAEGWLRTKFEDKDDTIRALVEQTMVERGLDPAAGMTSEVFDSVMAEAVKARQLSGFYRQPDTGELCVRGRHVKAMIKEDAAIAFPNERWGPTRKGTKAFFAEHVFVVEDWIPLGRTEPDGIDQRFVSTWRGTGIQYDEFVEDVKLSFTVVTDFKFTKKQWAELWLRAERNGLGAARSQGFGTFETVRFDSV